MKNLPEKIYLDLGFTPDKDADIDLDFDELTEVTWSKDNASGEGIEYVRKEDELNLHAETLLFAEWIGYSGFTWCEADDSYVNPKYGNLCSIETLFKLYKDSEK